LAQEWQPSRKPGQRPSMRRKNPSRQAMQGRSDG
jgi:hypothetical protein